MRFLFGQNRTLHICHLVRAHIPEGGRGHEIPGPFVDNLTGLGWYCQQGPVDTYIMVAFTEADKAERRGN